MADFRNELLARYRRAQARDIDRVCESEPQRCRTFAQLELLFMASHNDAVFTTEAERIDEVLERAKWDAHASELGREQRAQAQSERVRIGDAIQIASGAASDGFSVRRDRDADVVDSNECKDDSECGAGRSDSAPPKKKEPCSLDTDCPASYRCIKGGVLRGKCMQ
jgi:hypothetical protein